MLRKKLIQSVWQIPLLICTAVVVALGVNHWRSDGITPVGDWSAEARISEAAGESMVISLEESEQLFSQGSALFLDARPQDHYGKGHIRGALNLPWQEVDRYFIEMADRLEGAATIVTYCDGQSCELSHELALFLKEMGFQSVRVLVNGWTIWQQAGLPTQIGK